jgi:hypothetical protein
MRSVMWRGWIFPWTACGAVVCGLVGCGPSLTEQDVGEVLYKVPEVPGSTTPYPLPDYSKPPEKPATEPSQPTEKPATETPAAEKVPADNFPSEKAPTEKPPAPAQDATP